MTHKTVVVHAYVTAAAVSAYQAWMQGCNL